ncbi:MAG: SpoIID/LytB domain-containing protein [Oliverpabstia sp.]
MNNLKQRAAAVCLAIGLIPLLLTVFLSGKGAVKLKKQEDMEAYIPILMCRETPWDYEKEMLKAQAVLIRSSLYLYLGNGQAAETGIQEAVNLHRQQWSSEAYQQAYSRMKQAAASTQGQIIFYKGQTCQGVFHRVSAGTTRSGEEVLPGMSAEFLQSVESSQDMGAEEYLHGHYFTEEELRERLKKYYPSSGLSEESLEFQLEPEQRDTQGYILTVRVGNQEVSGEEFRVNLGLSSSNFVIQHMDGEIRFLCKGLGHGLGLSQYGANEMAKKGKNYQQILLTYFPDVTLRSIDFSNLAIL